MSNGAQPQGQGAEVNYIYHTEREEEGQPHSIEEGAIPALEAVGANRAYITDVTGRVNAYSEKRVPAIFTLDPFDNGSLSQVFTDIFHEVNGFIHGALKRPFAQKAIREVIRKRRSKDSEEVVYSITETAPGQFTYTPTAAKETYTYSFERERE